MMNREVSDERERTKWISKESVFGTGNGNAG